MSVIMYENEIMKDINISIAVEQNGKGQDHPFFGETASGKRYFGIWDGHGTDSVIRELRKYDVTGKLAEFMDESSPANAISNELFRTKICRPLESSGATMNYGILNGNVFTCVNCGDSKMFVFRNGELIFESEDHYWGNLKEKERLGDNIKFHPTMNIKAVSENKIIAVPSEYMIQKNGNRLAVTQAVGHCNISEPAPDVYVINIEPTDEIVAVSVSDGVTDMLIYDENNNIREQDIRMIYELSAESLKSTIQARWLKPWTMTSLEGDEIPNCKFKKTECDDVGVARMIIKPKI